MKVLAALFAVGLLAMIVAWVPEAPAQQQQPKAPAAAPPTVRPPAGAADTKQVQGAVKSVDVTKRIVTLQDGTTLMVTDDKKLIELRPGTMIKASVRGSGPRMTATSIEVVK
jgi:hypothetical protein